MKLDHNSKKQMITMFLVRYLEIFSQFTILMLDMRKPKILQFDHFAIESMMMYC